MLMVFMPALIFESAFKSNWHIFKHEIGQILIMAVPMLLCSIGLSAVMMLHVLGYGDEYDDKGKKIESFDIYSALMFGSIISATDPVAVVALLKELGASKRLATLIEGESLFNDGTAMVCFLVFQTLSEGTELGIDQILV